MTAEWINEGGMKKPKAQVPFDEKAWRKAYMQKYMKLWRQKMKKAKQAAKEARQKEAASQ